MVNINEHDTLSFNLQQLQKQASDVSWSSMPDKHDNMERDDGTTPGASHCPPHRGLS